MFVKLGRTIRSWEIVVVFDRQNGYDKVWTTNKRKKRAPNEEVASAEYGERDSDPNSIVEEVVDEERERDISGLIRRERRRRR